MKRVFILQILCIALFISGCAKELDQFKQVIRVATTTVANPVDAVDIYRVKNAYGASLQFAADWREYCWSKSYAALMKDVAAKVVCENRRSRVRAIQLAQAKAHSALSDAQVFILNHPTLNAATVLTAAWEAVTNFKNAVPAQ